MRTHAAGFSLLEALVTLFIVGMLSSAGVAMLSMTLDGRARIDETSANVAGLERAHAMLRSDLSQLVRRTTRDDFGGVRSFVFAGGAEAPGEPLLAFARTGRENPGGLEARGSTAYVEYLLRDGALVRRMAARTDPTGETPVAETVLLEGVAQADVAFATGVNWTPALRVPAGSTASFPRAVEIVLELEGAGDVRQLFLTGVEP